MSEAWVIDPSVLIQAFVMEPDTRRVRTLLYSLSQDLPNQLHTVDNCLVECTAVLWKHVRFQNMSLAYAHNAIKELNTLALAVYISRDFLPRALEIGVTHGLAVYDTLYIALAEVTGYPLITADNKQAKVAQAVGVSLKPLTDFPPYQP
jgi:predicted nucleic acid-binding protein